MSPELSLADRPISVHDHRVGPPTTARPVPTDPTDPAPSTVGAASASGTPRRARQRLWSAARAGLVVAASAVAAGGVLAAFGQPGLSSTVVLLGAALAAASTLLGLVAGSPAEPLYLRTQEPQP